MSTSDIRLILIFLVLCFLFGGEPDVWDHMHDVAIGKTVECAK